MNIQFHQELGQQRRPPIDWVGSALVAVLAGVTFFCLVAIFPVVWTAIADMGWRQMEIDLRRCVAINENASRLECFDRRIGRNPPHPARGANPPASIFGHGEGDNPIPH